MGRAGSALRDDVIVTSTRCFGYAVLAYADIFMYAAIIAFMNSSEFSRRTYKMPAEAVSSSRGCSALTACRIGLAG
jgi:hypothetical protein